MQIVFCSIITLIFFTFFFFFCLAGGTCEVLCGNIKFLSDSQKYNRSWLVLCSHCRYQYGLTNLVQLPLHLPCLCRSSLIFNLQYWKAHVELIVVPGKREGIDSHCLWLPDAKTYIYPIAYLILVVKRYMSGFPNFQQFYENAGLRFHLVASSSALDCLSASILIVPGICAAANHYQFLA